jgi:signal transduction histidine kinase
LVEAEKEKEAENVRLGISHDIHDEVGATLSGVALFSEIAKEKMQQQQTKDVQEYLEHISANSKEMVNKISDIVWAINPENDSYERIIEKLRAYAVNFCAGKGIVLHIDLDERLKDYHPPMHVKRNFYLFIKEGINNAIKYSNGKNIFLSVALESDSIVAVVRDDGNGFDTNKIYPGNGLNSMKARAENLNAIFDMDSHPGAGTAISLRFDFHPIGGQKETV